MIIVITSRPFEWKKGTEADRDITRTLVAS